MVPGTDYFEDDSTAVNYNGRKNLGEYEFMSANYQLMNENQSVTIYIDVAPYYDYHILNSFIPSLLITIISYLTLYFKIDDFNERIMVSLTSLLVLAALFSQASDSSVPTPYFKLLDIWFVTLIIFCFFIVLLTTLIRRFEFKDEKLKKINVLLEKNDETSEDSLEIKKCSNAERLNNLVKYFMPVIFSIFTLFYILHAANVM